MYDVNVNDLSHAMRKKVLFLITRSRSSTTDKNLEVEINIQSQYFRWSLKWYNLVNFYKGILSWCLPKKVDV